MGKLLYNMGLGEAVSARELRMKGIFINTTTTGHNTNSQYQPRCVTDACGPHLVYFS